MLMFTALEYVSTTRRLYILKEKYQALCNIRLAQRGSLNSPSYDTGYWRWWASHVDENSNCSRNPIMSRIFPVLFSFFLFFFLPCEQ